MAKKKPLKSERVSTGKPAPQAGASVPRRSLIRMVLLFVAFMGSFHAILWLVLPEWQDNFQVQDFITRLVSSVLNKLGVASFAHGNQIILKSNFLIVTQECTAINVLILFAAFILAYSSSAKAKIIALVIGIPFIFVANIARIVATGLVSEFFPRRYMELFHDYVWQTAFLFLVVTMWFVWIEMMVKREKTPAVPR